MLTPNTTIQIGGQLCRVHYVNFTGAFVVPVQPKIVTIVTANGKVCTFRRPQPGMLISNTSIDEREMR